MRPVDMKIDPAASDEGAMRCEPAGESDVAASKGDPWPDPVSEVDERVPEEAGYGHGV